MPAGPSRVSETLPARTLRPFASAPYELCGLREPAREIQGSSRRRCNTITAQGTALGKGVRKGSLKGFAITLPGQIANWDLRSFEEALGQLEQVASMWEQLDAVRQQAEDSGVFLSLDPGRFEAKPR